MDGVRVARELPRSAVDRGGPSDFLFAAPPQEESLARLHFLVERRRRVGLLRGVPGSGKTWVLRRFGFERRRAGDDVALLDVLGADGRELLWQLAQRLHCRIGAQENRFHLWRTITDRLLENDLQQRATVLLIDNIDQATDEASSIVLRLLHLEEKVQPRLTVILSVDERSPRRLDPRLVDLVDLTMVLEGWSERDVARYLSERTQKVERGAVQVDSDAPRRLWQLTGGNARQVVRLTDLAIVAASAASDRQLGPQLLDQVCAELTALPAAA